MIKSKDNEKKRRTANKKTAAPKTKETEPIDTFEQGTGSALLNFTAQTDNQKSNFNYIPPQATPAKTKVKRLVAAPTQSALKELWDSLDVEELKKQNKQTAKQQRADGAKNEKWQDEKYAAHMKKQAAKKKAKAKPAKKKAKLTKHEKTLAATELVNNLFQGMKEYAEIEKVKANTNKTQMRKDLEILNKSLKKDLTSKLFDQTMQILHDIIILEKSPSAKHSNLARNVLMPRLYSIMTDFFVRGGKWQNDTKEL